MAPSTSINCMTSATSASFLSRHALILPSAPAFVDPFVIAPFEAHSPSATWRAIEETVRETVRPPARSQARIRSHRDSLAAQDTVDRQLTWLAASRELNGGGR